MTDFKRLEVWQKAHALGLDIHRVVGEMRASGHPSIRNQILRAAMSIPTNIVEGSSQKTPREFARFLRIALNSSTELEYHLIAATDLQLIHRATSVTLIAQVVEVRKMIYGLLRYLDSRSAKAGTDNQQPEPTHSSN